MNNYLRPDEQATYGEIERSQRMDRNIKGAAKTAGKASLTAGSFALASGTKLASRILPFLSEYVPSDLAVKGINKISPELGGFLKKGMEKGLNIQDGLDFVKENLTKQNEPAKANGNIIQQYSPELHDFIEQEIKKGRSPLQAGGIAVSDRRFSDIIKKLSKEHKMPWSSILESVYGADEMAQQPTQQASQQTQAQPQQQNQGLDPAVAQILQQGKALLQKFKGGM